MLSLIIKVLGVKKKCPDCGREHDDVTPGCKCSCGYVFW